MRRSLAHVLAQFLDERFRKLVARDRARERARVDRRKVYPHAMVSQQAIDRVHRLGQKRAVIARRYVTALSIEEKIMRLKEHKLSLAKGLLDHEEGDSSLTIEDLKELLS